MTLKTTMQTAFRAIAKKPLQMAYSTPVRRLARKALNSDSGAFLRSHTDRYGLDDRLRRLTSEQLKLGKYFAKVNVTLSQHNTSSEYTLSSPSGAVLRIYTEQLSDSSQLQLKNLVVDEKDAQRYKFEPEVAEFSLTIGNGAFTTETQVKYDRQIGLQQHGRLYYATRGNVTNPTRIIFTFPDFGKTGAPIPYPVDTLSGVADSELESTLIVCFQDRYGTEGSSMLRNSSGECIMTDVSSEIEDIRDLYKVAQENLMFFGAGKGGSAAIIFARPYLSSRLLLVAPYLNMTSCVQHRTCVPFLQPITLPDDCPEPEDLLRFYALNGRAIDYIYNDDHSRNQSIIECLNGAEGLRKFRTSATSTRIEDHSYPTIVFLVHSFLARSEICELRATSYVRFEEEDFWGIQVRHKPLDLGGSSNWYIELASEDSPIFMQEVSLHDYPFVKFTSRDQYIDGRLVSRPFRLAITAYTKNGKLFRGVLSDQTETKQTTHQAERERTIVDESLRPKPLADDFIELEASPQWNILSSGGSTGTFRSTAYAPAAGWSAVLITDWNPTDEDADALHSYGYERSRVVSVWSLENVDLRILLSRIAALAGRDRLSVFDYRIDSKAIDAADLYPSSPFRFTVHLPQKAVGPTQQPTSN